MRILFVLIISFLIFVPLALGFTFPFPSFVLPDIPKIGEIKRKPAKESWEKSLEAAFRAHRAIAISS